MLLLDRNSEQGFVFASMMEFLSCWKAKQEATINIKCKEGRAMLNFSCSLGEPEQPHVAEGNLHKKRKARKTKSQIRRDAARAAALSPPPPSKRHNGKNKWQHILDWERSEFPAARSGPAAKVPPSLDQPSPEKLRHQQEEDEPFNDSELPLLREDSLEKEHVSSYSLCDQLDTSLTDGWYAVEIYEVKGSDKHGCIFCKDFLKSPKIKKTIFVVSPNI